MRLLLVVLVLFLQSLPWLIVSPGEEAAVETVRAEGPASEVLPEDEAPSRPARSPADAGGEEAMEAGDYARACRAMEDLAQQGQAEAVCQQYDELYEAFLLVDTNYTLASIAADGDIFRSSLAQELAYWDERWAEDSEVFLTACRAVTESGCAAAFEEYVGAEAFAGYAAYGQMSERETQLYDREEELVDEYYRLLAESEEDVYEYNGVAWTNAMLAGAEGDRLYEEDYEGYFEVYDGLMALLGEKVGPLFLELVELRNELAGLYGYYSYADYAYEHLYDRDYGTAEAQTFCEAVKEYVSGDYYDEIYYSDLSYDGLYRTRALSAGELIGILGDYAPAIDPVVEEAWQRLRSEQLYDLGSGSGRVDGGYCVELTRPSRPFIFLTLEGGAVDLSGLSHEFGHFVDSHCNPVPNVFMDVGSYDLFEIHSNGLEMLYLNFYPEIYGSEAPAAEFAVLGEQLGSVVEGCLYDEFQRRVYEKEDLTLADVNRIYSRLCVEYGQYYEVTEDWFWIYVSHNFDYPFYYISYAASALAALQIWQQSRTDYAGAVETWKSVLEAGAYEKGYMQVLEEAGLSGFADARAVRSVCRSVQEQLENWQ